MASEWTCGACGHDNGGESMASSLEEAARCDECGAILPALGGGSE